MGILQLLPESGQLSGILGLITGDAENGTGMAGVLSLLESTDASGNSASLASQLDQTISTDIAEAGGTLADGALAQFQQAVNALPQDPSSLIAPLANRFNTILDLSSSKLADQLLGGLGGLRDLESSLPVNTTDLIDGAAQGLSQLKGEFISGEFGRIRQWSDSVRSLYEQMQPFLSADADTLVERLLEFLQEKITDLVQMMLPRESLTTTFTDQLTGIVTTEQLATLTQYKADVADAMNQAAVAFENANFTNTTQLAAASDTFTRLTDDLAGITTRINTLLGRQWLTSDGLAQTLQRQFDDFDQIEIVDLGNIRDQFTNAIERVQTAIESIDLDGVRETIESAFTRINEAIERFDPRQLTDQLGDLQSQLQTVLDGLDSALMEAVATIRAAFTRIREALHSVASALGTYQEDGSFQFHVQQDIEAFLNSIRSTLEQTIQPMIVQFKETIGQTLQSVAQGLETVKDQIETVKTQLRNLLSGIHQQLEDLDVTQAMESISQRLDDMLGELGNIDFDPVVDPVIGEINEMRDSLRQIDVSSLNELARGALHLAVEVVLSINFTDDIINSLLEKTDNVLEYPRNALSDLEEGVEDLLQRFGELEPDKLLTPLDDLFQPVTEFLDTLDLANLLTPLDEWYDRAEGALDTVSPAALLQPVIDLYTQLESAFNAISPTQLIQPLQASIDEVKAEIQSLDITGIADVLSDLLERAQRQLDAVSPEGLLNPMINAFDKVMQALDRFQPAALLEPFAQIFETLTAPLDNINDNHVQCIAEIFAPLIRMPSDYDPRHVFETMQQAVSQANSQMRQLNPGNLMAELRGPYNAMKAAFESGSSSVDSDLSALRAIIGDLNPMRSEGISQTITSIQQLQERFAALEGTQPAGDLVNRYDQIQPQLVSLIPSWANENISAASVRRAFQALNPLRIVDEINQLYDAFKEQIRNIDPRVIQESLNETFDTIRQTLQGLDPQAVIAKVQEMIEALTQRLDAINLQLIADELEDIVDDVNAILTGLNPQPIIEQLEDLVEQVRTVVAELQPSEVLGELEAPFLTAKEIVAEFDPAILKEPIQSVFEDIQSILEEIDIGILLQPLTDRLEQLRDELEEGLGRTETAFNGMIAAIPV